MKKNTGNIELTSMLNSTFRFWSQFTVAVLLSSWIGFASSADLPDFTTLVKSNEAAVVNISTIGEGARNNRRGSPRNDQLEEFFRRFGPPLKETISLEVGRDLWAAVSYSKILAIFSRTTTSWPVPTK